MKIGWVGAGKLGMPCALALAQAGHTVRALDPSPVVQQAVKDKRWPYDEPGVTDLLNAGLDFALGSMPYPDVIFVAVQTPHDSAYGGSVPMPSELKPFDTSFLRDAVERTVQGSDAPIVIVSTVLPGTCRDVLEPVLKGRPYIYSPAFVAMGSVLDDLKEPEFVLAGVRDPALADLLDEVYAHVWAPRLVVKVESAELAKMAYNTAISTKIVLANALMEISHGTGADVSEVAEVLKHATDRVASARYLSGGMGDGGPCHPRDSIAMAWLADQLRLSADPFSFVTRAREHQTHWLAALVSDMQMERNLPIVILGRAYKPGVSLDDGSAAKLLAHYLDDVTWIDERCGFPAEDLKPAVYVLATPHQELVELSLPQGSVLIDPWGVALEQPGVEVVAVGR